MDWSQSVIESTSRVDNFPTTTLVSNGIGNGPVIDMRQFQGFYISMLATRNGVATNYNEVTLKLVWYLDAAGTIMTYADVYEILAFAAGPAFATLGGRLVGQDVLHGPFMRVYVVNVGADAVDVSYQLTGTTRNIPGPYYREMEQTIPPGIYNPDNFIVSPDNGGVVGAAAASDTFFPGLMRYGRARYRVTTNQNFTMTIFAGSVVTEFESIGPVGAGVYTGELVVPKRSCLVRIHNNAGVVMNAFFNMISQNEKF